MSNPRHTIPICCLCVISIILLSCGASHHLRTDQIYQAGDFTYSDLKHSGFIVGGVSSGVSLTILF